MANRRSHALKIESRKQNNLAAGLISERFPGVSGIQIQMTYYQKGANPVLMERTINMFPSSYAYFKMDCMIKGCVGGGFDLTSAVASMVKTRKKVKKGALVCSGTTDVPSTDHARIEYEIVMKYNKAS